jgi:hypothetical protein
MTTKISIHVETDDRDLAERIGRALNGNLTETVEGAPRPFVGEHSDAPDCTPPCDDQGCPAHYAGESHPQTANPAETAAGAENAQHAETTAGGAHTAGTPDAAHGAADQGTPRSDARRDQKGVAFNEHYCGEAQDPFYSSGKRSGQWKKKRGVSDADYDDWYAEELAELQGGQADTPRGEDDHRPSQVNSAAAFGNGGQEQQPQGGPAPQDTGSFMGWVSEKQAAGLLTQADIQEAYKQTGLQVPDLFPPNDPQTVANNIGKLYGLLAPKAGQ